MGKHFLGKIKILVPRSFYFQDKLNFNLSFVWKSIFSIMFVLVKRVQQSLPNFYTCKSVWFWHVGFFFFIDDCISKIFELIKIPLFFQMFVSVNSELFIFYWLFLRSWSCIYVSQSMYVFFPSRHIPESKFNSMPPEILNWVHFWDYEFSLALAWEVELLCSNLPPVPCGNVTACRIWFLLSFIFSRCLLHPVISVFSYHCRDGLCLGRKTPVNWIPKWSSMNFLTLSLSFPALFPPEHNWMNCTWVLTTVVWSSLPTSPICIAPWFNRKVHLRAGQSIFPTLQPDDSNTSMFHVLSCCINNLIYPCHISVSYIIAKFCNNMPFAVKCHQKVIYCNNFHLFHKDRQFLRFMFILSLKSESSYINL